MRPLTRVETARHRISAALGSLNQAAALAAPGEGVGGLIRDAMRDLGEAQTQLRRLNRMTMERGEIEPGAARPSGEAP